MKPLPDQSEPVLERHPLDELDAAAERRARADADPDSPDARIRRWLDGRDASDDQEADDAR